MVGSVTPCAPFRIPVGGCGAHGVTRPTGPVAMYRNLFVAVLAARLAIAQDSSALKTEAVAVPAKPGVVENSVMKVFSTARYPNFYKP